MVRGVSVRAKEGRAYYSGVMRCGSVWLCPVCAHRVSEVRQDEAQRGIDYAIKAGLGATFITLTFRHGIDDQLGEMLKKFGKALRRLKSGRAYKELRSEFGFMGDIRALEVTHGQNGWHPHTHAVTVTRRQIRGEDLTRLKDRIFALWYQACKKERLPLPDHEHGVDVRGAKYAAQYIAKWGFAKELAKPQLKRAKNGGRNPFQLLMDAAHGDKRAAWLWREFAIHFQGKRQIYWSHGLKQRLGLYDDLTDQQVLDLDDQPEGARTLCVIDEDTWNLVLRAEARGQVLDAALASREDLFGYLNHLRSTVPRWDGSIIGPRGDWIC